jgi:rhamnosyltransferase
VENTGLPRADFFMDMFDFEYSLRARSHGYRIAVISDCRFSHEIGNTRVFRIFGKDRLWTQQMPWREYYVARNLAYMAWRLRPTARMKQYAIKGLAYILVMTLLVGDHKSASFVKLVQGIHDGIRGKLGIRFRPGDFSRQIADPSIHA